MDRVGSEINGAIRANKVMRTNPELRREIPHTGVGVGGVVRDRIAGVINYASRSVGRRPSERGILVIRPKQSTCALHPRRKSSGSGEVPSQNVGCDGDAAKGSAYVVVSGA